MPNKILLTLNNGSVIEHNIPRGDWICDTFSPTTVGEHTFNYTLTSVPGMRFADDLDTVLSKAVRVSKPDLDRVEYNNTEILEIERYTDLEDVKLDLVSVATLHGTNGYTETYTIPASNWSSTDYDSNKAGVYTFTSTIELPSILVNTSNIKIGRAHV